VKRLLVAALILLATSTPTVALSSAGAMLARLGLGTVGGLAGSVVAIAVVAEAAPRTESRPGSVAVVVGSLTVYGGLGGSFGVLAAASLFEIQGNVRRCLLGGLAGGLASAFTEPILYTIGVRPAFAEGLGFLMLPILPAVGATLGHTS